MKNNYNKKAIDLAERIEIHKKMIGKLVYCLVETEAWGYFARVMDVADEENFIVRTNLNKEVKVSMFDIRSVEEVPATEVLI